MTCHELTVQLLDHLEGKLPAHQSERLEKHLHGCVDCQTYVRTYRRTGRLVRDAVGSEESTEIPDDLVDSILDSRDD